MSTQRIILGIDPGTSITGFGVISGIGQNPKLLELGEIKLAKIEDPYKKLHVIFQETQRLIDKYKVTELAIEAPFYGKNIQSMLKLGRAQGTAIAAAINRNLPIFEYAPRKIKLAITGRGNASKEQVAFVLQRMLGFQEIPHNLDATDGLAAAVCHFFQNSFLVEKGTKNKSWKDFIANNPDRIV
jgi:crossover junction endodeoxyribonuclease RuvC